MIPSNCRTCVCYSYENWNRCRDWQTGCNCHLIPNKSCNHREWPSKGWQNYWIYKHHFKSFFCTTDLSFLTLILLSVLFFTLASILSCAFLLILNFPRTGNFSLTEEYFPGYEWILGEPFPLQIYSIGGGSGSQFTQTNASNIFFTGKWLFWLKRRHGEKRMKECNLRQLMN